MSTTCADREIKMHQHHLHRSGCCVDGVKVSPAKSRASTRNASRGRVHITCRDGGDECPRSPSTSATDSSTDSSSKDRRQHRPAQNTSIRDTHSRRESSKSLLYPPPPPIKARKNDELTRDNRRARSQSQSHNQGKTQYHDEQKSRQQTVRPTTEQPSSGHSSRSQSRSIGDNHNQQQQQKQSTSSGRSVSRPKEKPSHPKRNTKFNTISPSRSKSPYTARVLDNEKYPPNSTTSSSSSGYRGDGIGMLIPTCNTAEFDQYGCCIHHPIIQLRRPSSTVKGGWRTLSKFCALCIKEAEEEDRTKRTVSSSNKSVNHERHHLEKEHSKFNTTTVKRRSIDYEVIISSDSSVESSPTGGKGEEGSITLSCLESDDDGPPSSSVSSPATSSVPMKTESKSVVSRSTSSSHESHRSHKSYASQRSRKSEKADIVADEHNDRRRSKSVSKVRSASSHSKRRSCTSKQNEEARNRDALSLERVESALRRIKRLEKMSDEKSATSTSSSRKAKYIAAENDDRRPRISTPSTAVQLSAPEEIQSSLVQTVSPLDDMSDLGTPETNKEWMKYATSASARDAAYETDDVVSRRGKTKARANSNLASNSRKMMWKVKKMPYCDPFGDHGIYTGHVNDEGRPDGTGSMKYENGVFYEGTWTDGQQDAAAQYARIRSGFTSWGGKGKSATKSGMVLPWNARKNDTTDVNEKSNVRGMEWTDFKGQSGRYTGEVNHDNIPHGNGMMRYDFGLIAEGEWVRGVLKEGPLDHLAVAIGSGQSVVSGMHRINSSLSIGTHSVGFPSGAVSTVSGAGGVSVFMPPSIVGLQQFMPTPQSVVTHQNMMMNNGVYPGFVMPMQQMQYMPMQQQNQTPPVSSIFIS